MHMYMYHACTFVGCCLSFCRQYLEAEVVEVVMGWLGLVDTTTANKNSRMTRIMYMCTADDLYIVHVYVHTCVHVPPSVERRVMSSTECEEGEGE